MKTITENDARDAVYIAEMNSCRVYVRDNWLVTEQECFNVETNKSEAALARFLKVQIPNAEGGLQRPPSWLSEWWDTLWRKDKS